MSTGVYRQYATQRLNAPLVTGGRPLGSPIGAAALARAYDQPDGITRLIPLGIAALIPVIASFVPQPAVAQVPRATYPVQAIAEYLPTYQPSDQAPAPAVMMQSRTASSSIQLAEPGIAPLLPVAAAFVPPVSMALPARIAPQVQDPQTAVAPFFSPNTTDTVLAVRLATSPSSPASGIQIPEPGVAALLPVAATYIPPAFTAGPMPRASNAPQIIAGEVAPFLSSNTTDTVITARLATYVRERIAQVQIQASGVAAILPVATPYIAPSALAQPRDRAARGTQQPSSAVLPQAVSIFVSYRAPVQIARREYTIRQIRAFLVQGSSTPVVVVPISGQTATAYGPASVTVTYNTDTTVNGPASGTVDGPEDVTVNGPDDTTVNG